MQRQTLSCSPFFMGSKHLHWKRRSSFLYKSACSAMTRKHMFSVLTLMTPYHAQLSKGMSGNVTGRTWEILSWRLKIPVTCSTKFQVHLTIKVSYFEYRKVTKYIYINYIYTSFIITRERNCYSTLLGTINVETSSNSIPIDFSRSKLSTTGGHWRSKKYLSKPLR